MLCRGVGVFVLCRGMVRRVAMRCGVMHGFALWRPGVWPGVAMISYVMFWYGIAVYGMACCMALCAKRKWDLARRRGPCTATLCGRDCRILREQRIERQKVCLLRPL